MNVDDVVRAQIAAAVRRREWRRRKRAEQEEARRYGLAARHAAKLRHLAECGPEACGPQPPSAPTPEGITVPVRITLADARRLERELTGAAQRLNARGQWADDDNTITPEAAAYENLVDQSIAAWAALAEQDLTVRRAAVDARLQAWAEGNEQDGGQP